MFSANKLHTQTGTLKHTINTNLFTHMPSLLAWVSNCLYLRCSPVSVWWGAEVPCLAAYERANGWGLIAAVCVCVASLMLMFHRATGCGVFRWGWYFTSDHWLLFCTAAKALVLFLLGYCFRAICTETCEWFFMQWWHPAIALSSVNSAPISYFKKYILNTKWQNHLCHLLKCTY